MVGLLGFALATGCCTEGFRVRGSSWFIAVTAIIAPYQGINGWMFRFASKSHSELLDAEVNVIMTRIVNEDGREIRKFYPLELERNKITMLSMSWTIVHPIDEKSPMKDLTYADLEKSDAEFLVFFKAFDDTFADMVRSRTSFRYDQVVYGAKFSTIIGTGNDGSPQLDFAGISNFEKADLNYDAEKLTA
jgi:inward rectifier potassium channel